MSCLPWVVRPSVKHLNRLFDFKRYSSWACCSNKSQDCFLIPASTGKQLYCCNGNLFNDSRQSALDTRTYLTLKRNETYIRKKKMNSNHYSEVVKLLCWTCLSLPTHYNRNSWEFHRGSGWLSAFRQLLLLGQTSHADTPIDGNIDEPVPCQVLWNVLRSNFLVHILLVLKTLLPKRKVHVWIS